MATLQIADKPTLDAVKQDTTDILTALESGGSGGDDLQAIKDALYRHDEYLTYHEVEIPFITNDEVPLSISRSSQYAYAPQSVTVPAGTFAIKLKVSVKSIGGPTSSGYLSHYVSLYDFSGSLAGRNNDRASTPTIKNTDVSMYTMIESAKFYIQTAIDTTYDSNATKRHDTSLSRTFYLGGRNSTSDYAAVLYVNNASVVCLVADKVVSEEVYPIGSVKDTLIYNEGGNVPSDLLLEHFPLTDRVKMYNGDYYTSSDHFMYDGREYLYKPTTSILLETY